MIIVRDEQRIARLRTIGQVFSFAGMASLLGGLVLVFSDAQNLIPLQLLALSGGWLLSQVGMYLTHRYLRRPRPDEVLDEALSKVIKDGRLYHYVLPAPHVLLTPNGIIIFNLKYQRGEISVDEEDRWTQRGIGMQKFFGQEGVGNPPKETLSMVKSVASFINKHVPAVRDKDIPIAPMIVFTTKGVKDLDLAKSTMPAMHYTKVKGFLKTKYKGDPLPSEDFAALQAAFDEKVSRFLDELETE